MPSLQLKRHLTENFEELENFKIWFNFFDWFFIANLTVL